MLLSYCKVTIPAGYHNGNGYVNQSISTMGGQTITPSSSAQTVSCSGKYMTGNVVVNAIPSNYANISGGSIAVFNMGNILYFDGFAACSSSGSYEDGALYSYGTLPGSYSDGSINYFGRNVGMRFKRSVNMAPFSKIRISYTPTGSLQGTQKMGVANTSKTILTARAWGPINKTTATLPTDVYSEGIDISSVKQQAVFFIHANGVSASIKIRKIELIV